jgi:hypothetical protein
MAPAFAIPGTLYADWLSRRERLARYRGDREAIVTAQIRVLDYLIERYRDDAAALTSAPPQLDTVYVNQRAIVINHHRSLGLVAGVKSRQEAGNRIASLVARMYDSGTRADEGLDLGCPAVSSDPWFGHDEPNERTLREKWQKELAWHASGWFVPGALKPRLRKIPYLPRAFIEALYNCAADITKSDQVYIDAAEALSMCRNRIAPDYIARAWRERVAAMQHDAVTDTLRAALVNWEACAADTIRCLLADEISEVRMQAARLLADIGDLRDIGLLGDLLAMPLLPDEEPGERFVLAQAMENLAFRLRDDR